MKRPVVGLGGTVPLIEEVVEAKIPVRRLNDLDARWWGGSATGEMFKTLFALANSDPGLATWSNAIKIAEKTGARCGGNLRRVYDLPTL
jgi:hypothetical protein